MVSVNGGTFINNATCICIETQVLCPGFYLKCTFKWTLSFCNEILQYFQYTIYPKDWLLQLVEETSTGQYRLSVILNWCLKQVKDFILELSISRSFFSFPSGECVDEVAKKSNKLSRIQNMFIFFDITHWKISFMNGEGVCYIIRGTIFNVWICLDHSRWFKHNQS